MDWSIFFGVLAGVVGTRAYLWMRGRLAQPYRWKCPHCEFKMAMSQNSAVFTKIQYDHVNFFHSDKATR